MRSRTRTALILATVVGCTGVAVGAAVAFSHDESSPRVLTRAESYVEGMTLGEVVKAASGEPGELAPPCPDGATVTKLKSAGLAFGPCDPSPEEGQPFRVPRADETEDAEGGGDACPGIILGKGVDLDIELPCAPGAEIVDATAVKIADAYCAELTYVARTGAAPRTETLCEGDVPAIGGKVQGPSTAGKRNHEDDHEH